MKKVILSFALIATMISCQNEDKTVNVEESNTSANRICASDDVLKNQQARNPNLVTKMNEIEAFTQNYLTNPLVSSNRLVNGVIEIPVVFNVLYRTTSENVSLAQLQSQIDVLNRDFNAANSDFNTANNPYSSVRANVGIRFVLDQVIRKATSKSSWGTNDAMKKSASGGLNPTSPTNKLNYWVCTIGGGILGYAQFPGGSSATDGVVIGGVYTGNQGSTRAPYNLGRTATHEVGHWMNLRHIWGDATCGNDLVSDTPTMDSPNSGVPAVGTRSTCSGNPLEMYMNYMDYTDDRGMYMFSNGQKDRMTAVFAVGGSRTSFR